MSQGVPSHDTFGRVFSTLSTKAFQHAFIAWAEGLGDTLDGKVVAIDGKSVRRSHDRRKGQGPIHMLNAWRSDVGVSLGQVATDQKSNEITAVPELGTDQSGGLEADSSGDLAHRRGAAVGRFYGRVSERC